MKRWAVWTDLGYIGIVFALNENIAWLVAKDVFELKIANRVFKVLEE